MQYTFWLVNGCIVHYRKVTLKAKLERFVLLCISVIVKYSCVKSFWLLTSVLFKCLNYDLGHSKKNKV